MILFNFVEETKLNLDEFSILFFFFVALVVLEYLIRMYICFVYECMFSHRNRTVKRHELINKRQNGKHLQKSDPMTNRFELN